MRLHTIGFTKKPASRFFELLEKSGVRRVVDVRLSNVSQLAGFAKKNDLAFFLREICGIDYVHMPSLAPTKSIRDDFKKKGGDWRIYEEHFMALMRERRIENEIPKQLIDGGCLLCSEDQPHHCHRRLVAEYLREHWGDIEVVHLS